MAILGFRHNISKQLRPEQAQLFAQWIGCANVIRNQKIFEYKSHIKENNSNNIDQKYSHIKKNKDLTFLKNVPVQILRNASSAVFSDSEAAKKGIRKFPKVKNKFKKRSVVLTKELFVIEPFFGKTRLHIKNHDKKGFRYVFSVVLPYKPEQIGNQVRISRHGRQFTLSAAFYDGAALIDPNQTLDDLSHLNESELRRRVTGVDRGVALHVCSSDGFSATWSPDENDIRKKRDAKIRHYQKILAKKKRKAGNKTKACKSKRQALIQHRITKLKRSDGNFRTNKNHHTSKALVASANQVIGLEALVLPNMTKKAKPKPNEDGKGYARNNARAKSGLNRVMLDVALGQLAAFVEYKALHQGKVVVKEINPAGTSQRCNRCGSRHTERRTQSEFQCLDCGNQDNADNNASHNIADDTVIYIKERKFAQRKTRKSITARKKISKLGNESPSTQKINRLAS